MPDTKKSSRRISSRKLSNLKVVVLCILAATTFWILNALNKDNYTTIVDYPIAWEYDTERFYPVKPLPKSIQIQITGNGWDLLRKYFNLNEPPYPIPLANPAEKKFLLASDLKRSLGEFLTPTQLIGLLEDSIPYQIDRIETISLIPKLDSASYTLAKNAIIEGDIAFEPKSITVKGPSSVIELFEGYFPVQLDQKNLDEDFSDIVDLSLEKSLAEFVELEIPEIKVSFSVVNFLEGNKRLKVKKINFPRTVSLEDEEITPVMTYLVDERFVDELKELEFEAVLDYSKRNRSDSTLSIQVSPSPKYIKGIKVEPEKIRLKYGQ